MNNIWYIFLISEGVRQLCCHRKCILINKYIKQNVNRDILDIINSTNKFLLKSPETELLHTLLIQLIVYCLLFANNNICFLFGICE